MEIARNLRDERGGGDIITVDSGDENAMHESEKKVGADNLILRMLVIKIITLLKSLTNRLGKKQIEKNAYMCSNFSV